MSNRSQTLQRGWNKMCGVLLLSFVAAFGTPRSAEAHNILSEFIQHGVQLSVGARHTDVTVELTFFEEWSARERKVMDADDSGEIARAEQEAYLKKLSPSLFQRVKLRIAGRELVLVPLYEPEMDLLGDHRVGPAHHRLRLFFFSPTPALHAGDEITIEVSLWPEAKSLATPQTEGRDGCKLVSLVSVDSGFANARAQDEKRWFRFRCVQPPTRPPRAMSSSSLTPLATAASSASPREMKTSATPSAP